MSVFRIALLLGSIFASVPIVSADEGPPIGVLLRSNPQQVRLASPPDERIFLESESKQEVIPPGPITITFQPGGLQMGTVRFGREPLRLRGERRGPITVGKRRYEGWIEILPKGDDRWEVVNRLTLERYLLGVVPSEMPLYFPPEALRGQAIVSRTYALYHILVRKPSSRCHLRPDTGSQVYKGVPAGGHPDLVLQVVNDTRGQVLRYDEQIFETFFHSTCGGATSTARDALGTADLAPLRSVPCDHCAGSPFRDWEERVIPETQIRSALDPLCRKHRIPLGQIRDIVPTRRGPGGHAYSIRIDNERGAFVVDANEFRLRVGPGRSVVPSTAFECSPRTTGFRFRGRGFGHGVGLCQYGARGLADAGHDAVGILLYYYPGSEVVQVWQ